MSVDSSWLGQIEREWAQLRLGDPSLDVERFFRHVVSANKVGFLSLESIAAISNGLLTSPLSGAPYLGRRLIERVGPHRHPSLRVALALSLVTETGGPADCETGHVILGDVLKDAWTSTSRWPRACMPRHWSLDTGRPRTTLGCTGRGTGTEVLPAMSSPTAQRRHKPTSAEVRMRNAPPVSTHCVPVSGKPRQSLLSTLREPSSACSVRRLLEQAPLPVPPLHPAS